VRVRVGSEKMERVLVRERKLDIEHNLGYCFRGRLRPEDCYGDIWRGFYVADTFALVDDAKR